MKRHLCAWLFALLLAGCSDDDKNDNGAAAPTCAEGFTVCGGDVVGQWSTNLPLCMPSWGEHLPAACADSYIRTQPTPDAVFNYRADGTYTRVETVHFEIDESYSAACLEALSGEPGTAETFCTEVYGGSFADGRCTLSGPFEIEFNEEGTYTAVDNVVALTPSDGTPGLSFPYCVRGRTMFFQLTDFFGIPGAHAFGWMSR
jgi:hypothetical protein